MRPNKTPTSSLSGSHTAYCLSSHLTTITATVFELLFNMVWYRTQAKIQRIRSGDVSPRSRTTRPSPATRLPQEIVEMIIANLIHDKYSLLVCSLTCYSWYIAAVPHLHHTLRTRIHAEPQNEKLWWPDSFLHKHKLGLLSSAKKFQVRGSNSDSHGPASFSSKLLFDRHVLRQFSALTNIRELGIDYLDIPSFMPKIRRYFRHFVPTVRSLALREPLGSRRQIIFFIGLFQHLEDLKLLYTWVDFQDEPANDLTLVPSFVPPLRGWLTMASVTKVGILEDMIDLFGGIRFRHMDLFCVCGMRLLLGACTETLETLRLYPNDPCGEEVPLKGVETLTNDFAAISSLQDFDLSRNKSLRTLEVTAQCIDVMLCTGSLDTASSLKYALSTITSPVFSEVVILYRHYDFCGIGLYPPHFRELSQTERAREAARNRRLFGVLHEMYKVRDYKLVLCADVWDYLRDYAVRELKCVVATEKAEGRLDNLPFEPSVTHSPRRSHFVLGEMHEAFIWRYGRVLAEEPL